MRVNVIFVTVFTILVGQSMATAGPNLTSLCGFDFEHMEWKAFNNALIIKRYGRGCGYNPKVLKRKHVFYLAKQKIWVQYNITTKDSWLSSIRVSRSPLCKDKVQPKTVIVCKTKEGLRVWDSKAKLERLYGKGEQQGNKITYTYFDLDVTAVIQLRKGIISSVEIISNLI